MQDLSDRTSRLECGFERPKLHDYFLPISAHLAIIPLWKLELYLTAIAAFGLAFVGLGFVMWRQWITPGGYLSLKPLADPRLNRASLRGIKHRPRMTIRRAMAVVAATACLLGIAAQDRRNRCRTEIDVLREQYRFMAAMHAGQETIWTQQHAQMAEMEESLVKNVEALSIVVRSDPHQESCKKRLERAKQMLLDHRSRRANYTRRSSTEAQAKEKYVRAAKRPWESVE